MVNQHKCTEKDKALIYLVVLAKEGNQVKLIRFGQQGIKGSPVRKGESDESKNRRSAFKARFAKDIKRGKMSAAYWANLVKW